MKDEFSNRQAMHLTVLDLLNQPRHKSVWENQPPTAFTAKVTEFRTKVTALTDTIARQENIITGLALEKDREETELEDLAHELGQALATYFDDTNREAEATEIDLPRSGWRRLRDASLLAKARLLLDRLQSELSTAAPAVATYGLTPADAALLGKEIADYESLIASPASSIAGRRALTASLRPAFREISELLRSLDRLILRFRGTPAGQDFTAAYQAARTIRDLGSAPQSQSNPATPTQQ